MRKFLIIALFFIFSINVFGLPIDDFIKKDRSNLDFTKTEYSEEIPLVVGNKIVVTNDDNKIVIQRLNPLYQRRIVYNTNRRPYPLADFEVVTSLIMCENGHVLGTVRHPEYYFTEPNYFTLKLERDEDFKNVTLYKLLFDFEFNGKPQQREWLIWFGHDKEQFCCGCRDDVDYSYLTKNKSQDFINNRYELLKDMCIKYTQDDLERLRMAVKTYTIVPMSLDNTFTSFIYLNDRELSQKISDDLNELQQKAWSEEYGIVLANRGRLKRYTLPIWLAVRDSEWNAQVPRVENLSDELPRTEEELKDYITWITRGFRPFFDDEVALDIYKTPIKFELTEEGVLATSAGEDKEFGTEDDQSFLSEYANRFIDKWNYSPNTLYF